MRRLLVVVVGCLVAWLVTVSGACQPVEDCSWASEWPEDLAEGMWVFNEGPEGLVWYEDDSGQIIIPATVQVKDQTFLISYTIEGGQRVEITYAFD